MAMERRVLLANGQYITIVQTTGTSTEDVMSQNAVTTELNTKLSKTDAISFIKTVETATQLSSAPTSATTQHTVTANGASKTVDYVIGEMVRVPSSNSDTGYEFYQLHNKTAQSGAVWSVVGGDNSSNTYETVIVTVTHEDGTAVTGVTVNIAGVPYVTGSDGKTIGKVLLGTSYTVECNGIIGYMAPLSQTFTAQVPQREVSMVYGNIKSGVFIEATNMGLYVSSEWSSNKTANSIVVVGNGVSFRMAVTQPSSMMAISSAYTDPLENYMTAISSSTEAILDYDGAGNTARIMKMQPSTSYAAGYCNAFTFPDGKTRGYLPSFGQLWLAYQNKAAVNAALTACGGTAMAAGYHQSSTFWGIYSGTYRRCWSCQWNQGYTANENLTESNYIRPFAAYQ